MTTTQINVIINLIIAGLGIAGTLWVYKFQRGVIKALKERCEALQAQLDSAIKMYEVQGSEIEKHKKMLSLDDISQYIDIHVSLRVSATFDEVTKKFIEDNKLFEKAVELVRKDHNAVLMHHFNFLMYVIRKNSLNNEEIKGTVTNFFPTTPWLYEIIIEKLPQYDFIKPSRISEPEKQKSLNQ